MKKYHIIIYSKSIKNTLNLIIHNYIAIPELNLEIHPGRFYYGTHHDIGKFKNRSEIITEMYFCKDCLDYLLYRARSLFDIWYYPILNCETLTRGLTQHFPLSIQTVLITGIFTSFIIGISNPIFFALTFFFILILLIYNNTKIKHFKASCIHYE